MPRWLCAVTVFVCVTALLLFGGLRGPILLQERSSVVNTLELRPHGLPLAMVGRDAAGQCSEAAWRKLSMEKRASWTKLGANELLLSSLEEHLRRHFDWFCFGQFPEKGFVIARARSGLANRMLNVASAFALTLASNRTLLLDWLPQPGVMPAQLSDLFHDPGWRWDWADHADLLGCVSFRLSKDVELMWGSGSSGGVGSMTNESEPALLSLQSNEGLSTAEILTVQTNQYWLPLLQQSPAYRAKLRALFEGADGYRQLPVRILLQILFSPNARVLAKVQARASLSKGNATCSLGVQIRTLKDDRGRAQYGLDAAHFVKCLDSANTSYRYKPSAHRNWRVVSDSEAWHETRTLEERSEGWGVASSRSTPDASRQALAELLWLSKCEHLFTSHRSTFGYVAALLSPRSPSSVSVISQRGCWQATCLDPCFQGWKMARQWFNASVCCIDRELTKLTTMADH
jgi:hypothetical protein